MSKPLTEMTLVELAVLHGTYTPPNKACEAELIRRQARVERLEAALRPFAEFCRIYDNRRRLGLAQLDGDSIYCHRSEAGDAIITLGHVRAAREALEP